MGLPLSAMSCAQALAALGLQTNGNTADLTYLTATWDTGLQNQAARIICVVKDDDVGWFDGGDLGGAQIFNATLSQDFYSICL